MVFLFVGETVLLGISIRVASGVEDSGRKGNFVLAFGLVFGGKMHVVRSLVRYAIGGREVPLRCDRGNSQAHILVDS